MPSHGLMHTLPKLARYSEAAAISRAYWGCAAAPELAETEHEPIWIRAPACTLLLPAAVGFWTEHSDRPVLATWVGALRIPRDDIDRLGRWQAKGSGQ
eukprot:13974101-Alexandrium_andersonii.AAC.1